jgi:hypothetical protein
MTKSMAELPAMFFAAPKDQQWALKKQKPTQFGDAKHTPHTKQHVLVAETMEQFKINTLVDREVEKVLSQTDLGRTFLADLIDRKLNEPTPES